MKNTVVADGRTIRPKVATAVCIACVGYPNGKSLLKRFLGRRKDFRQAIEELIQANQLIQAKYDEVRRLANDLEVANQQLIESKGALESQKAVLIESERKYRHLFENGSRPALHS